MRNIVLSRDAVSELLGALRYARRAHQRVMLVLTGDNDGNLVMGAVEAMNIFLRAGSEVGEGILYVYHAFYEDGCARREMFERALKQPCNVSYVPYHESIKLLGRTFDAAVIDLINNLEPNDLGRLSGIVDGGGLYVLLMPPLDKLTKEVVTRFQSTLLTPQYGPEHLRRYFERRFVAKLYEHRGIIIYDVDERRLLKTSDLPRRLRAFKRTPPEVPEKRLLPEPIYRLALTRDQVEVLKLLENLPSDSYTVSLAVHGDLLFQCDWTSGLKVYDISNPDDIELADTVIDITENYKVQWAVACAASDGYAYLLDANGYFFVLDTSNPADVQFVTGFNTAGRPWDSRHSRCCPRSSNPARRPT